MNSEILIIGKPFVSHVDQTLTPSLPLEFLNRAYVRHFTNNDNLLKYGHYKLMGYVYDFKPYLKLYVYKQYGIWNEAYAPNKTLLRSVLGGKVDKIIEQ